MAGSQAWRRLVAVLADPGRRLLYAQIVVAEQQQPLRPEEFDGVRRRQLRALTDAGLVEVIDGGLVAADPFHPVLAAGASTVPTGPDRFLAGGVLRGLPRRASDRDEVFGWIAGRVLAAEEEADEKEVTRRLGRLADDPVALRRHLVDAGVLIRTPDGRSYRRPGGAEPQTHPGAQE